INYQAYNLCKRATTFCENTRSSSMISTGCEREGPFTVQVGPNSRPAFVSVAVNDLRGSHLSQRASDAARNVRRKPTVARVLAFAQADHRCQFAA
ncbi:MAG: hypothetical protein ABR878_12195, partial [Roseiarcus sp.]